MKLKINRKATTILKIVISLLALGFVILKTDVSSVLAIYQRSNLLLVAFAISIFVSSKFLAAIRLKLFLERSGVKITRVYNYKLYLLGMFYNLFLPGGVGGDGYKIYLLSKRQNIKASKLFWAVLTDRLSGIMALFILAIILSLFLNFSPGFGYKAYIWLLIPLALAASYYLLKKFLPWLRPVFGSSTLLSIAVQILQTVCAYLIFIAIGGAGNVTGYLFLFLVSSVVAMLPISIGGIGTREVTFLFGSGILQLDQNISIAMSLMFYLVTAFVSFWGVYFSLNPKSLATETGQGKTSINF